MKKQTVNRQGPGKVTLPDPPSSWEELTREQLIYIHSLPKGKMDDVMYRLSVFLHLAGLELCRESYYTSPDADGVTGEGENVSVRDINTHLRWMRNVIEGTAPVTVILRRAKKGGKVVGDDKTPELMAISDHDLYDAVMHFTRFIDEPYVLTDNRIGDIVLGEHTYHAPEELLTNISYEQYRNASSAIGMVTMYAKQLDELRENLQKLSKAKSRKKADDVRRSEILRQMHEYADEITSAQADFMAALLIVRHPVVRHEEVVDSKGRKRVVKRTYLECHYDSIESERLTDEIRANAPSWLFSLLYQHYQSSMERYRKDFGKLFKASGAAENSNPIISSIGTLNTLMKEQGYQNQQAVLEANAIFNFQILDSLQRRAEEMEKMNQELKRKSKKR